MSKPAYILADVVAASKGKMEYTNLGNTGLRVSKVCLGCMSYGSKKWQSWMLEESEALPLIGAAYEAGVNFFDTANIYSGGESERILGKAIKEYKMDRDSIVVATKLNGYVQQDLEDDTNLLSKEAREKRGLVNHSGQSRKSIFQAVEASLSRLQLDYIDLYQIHRFDPATPIKEVMRALHDLVVGGKVRYIGASSMYTHQFMEMQYIARTNGWTEFISMQNLYNAVQREEEHEMAPACLRAGVSWIPWQPLSGGFLARKVDETSESSRASAPWFRGVVRDDSEKAVNKVIEKIAETKGVNMAQVALAWVLKNPVVASPIVGISNPRALDDALRSVHVVLSEEESKEIEGAYKRQKYAAGV